MKAKAPLEAKVLPRRTAHGPEPDYAGDRGGLVRYLVNKGRERGLSTAAIAKAIGISGEHFGNIRKGRTSTKNFADRWAQALGIDLNDPSIQAEIVDEFMLMLKDRLSDPSIPSRNKVLDLDDLLRSMERETPVRVELLFRP
jgi:hypothetical protein